MDDVAPIKMCQYDKRRAIKGQEFTRVIGLWMQAISIVKDRAIVNITIGITSLHSSFVKQYWKQVYGK